MAATIKPVVALLAPPEATASTLYGLFDLFSSAGRDWNAVMHGRPGESRLAPVIVSRDGRGFRAGNGAWIEPDAALSECPRPQAVCIPDLMVAPDEPLSGRYLTELAWLRHCHSQGALLAAACTGALLLAEANLLTNRDATTHWAYCDALAKRHPEIRVHANRALVATGDGERIIMAGGGTSWLDLALFLVARLLDTEEAMHLARLYLIDWHREGQQPFAALTASRQVEDAVIGKCQIWAAQHYDTHAPVAEMIQLSGLTERSFKRRFKSATGMTPIEYVHTLRLEEAKLLLETTDTPIEAIAGDVGYEDPSFFRQLFMRRVALTPGQYRRRFRTMRLAMQ
ncbi:GlxA family transcriptional regulator [Modicisalibacter xianhensis]|uniref:AraC family transcriptional regulator with amidase-like domain n=1 Tax=Modicisalibacter xianhensis TaxID=442341 RepID=A0A1I2YRK8_9GAMM|nr:helix-turn-helix domain-containing protein [Halomonas xianhensis]TDX31621.1 AraC family transcriptional regulator with amidase-like domain [Halomonas xianhensis]SFH27909.1 Transcriptional regulator GlxA family, contains an amidase domain and an AraC-type DNA-binding HTH domain [Halomonas xianhensis]